MENIELLWVIQIEVVQVEKPEKNQMDTRRIDSESLHPSLYHFQWTKYCREGQITLIETKLKMMTWSFWRKKLPLWPRSWRNYLCWRILLLTRINAAIVDLNILEWNRKLRNFSILDLVFQPIYRSRFQKHSVSFQLYPLWPESSVFSFLSIGWFDIKQSTKLVI